MDGNKFLNELKTLFRKYLTEKYKSDKMPLFDAVLSWGYSINSYSHIKQSCDDHVIQEDDDDGNDYISIDSYIELTISDKLNLHMIT